MATDKTYSHALFSTADPLVKNHLEQSLYACNFRLKFPHFFQFLVKMKPALEKTLRQKLIYWYARKYRNFCPQYLVDINFILNERRFLDHAIAYIQSRELNCPDFFILSAEIASVAEIRGLYEAVWEQFWENFVDELDDIKRNDYVNNIIVNLDLSKYYLPNLFPIYTSRELLLTFIPIFLSYGLFLNSNTVANSKKLPTAKDCIKILNPLLDCSSPIFFNSKSYINPITKIGDSHLISHFSLQMSLDEPLENLTYILRDYLISYQSRRMDYMKAGSNRFYNESEIYELNILSEIGKDILAVLDKYSNKRIGNRRNIHTLSYDAILNAIIAVDFFDYYMKVFFEGVNLLGLDLNEIELFKELNPYIENFNDDVPYMRRKKFSTVFNDYIEDLAFQLEKTNLLRVKLSRFAIGDKKINNINIMLNDDTVENREEQCKDLNINGLKKSVKDFLKKRVDNVDKFIEF